MNVVWGFNGTIIPFMSDSAFCSSDRILLDYLRANGYLSFWKKSFAACISKSDRNVRSSLGAMLKDQPSLVLENVSKIISRKISDGVLSALDELCRDGFRLYLISCSTDSLIKNSLSYRNESDKFFRGIFGNRASTYGGAIIDYECLLRTGRDKVELAEKKLHLKPSDTIVVGSWTDDIPLLEWSDYPILIDASRGGWERYKDKNFIFIESAEMLPGVARRLL